MSTLAPNDSTPPAQLSCRQLIDSLLEFVEGTPTPEFRRAFEVHLTLCPSCRNYLDSYRQTIALTQDAFATSPAPMPPELARAILAARQSPANRSVRPKS